jgi:hypothetical protein
MRIPDPGPLGETRFEASERAMVAALLVNNPFGGKVDTVLTSATHFFAFLRATLRVEGLFVLAVIFSLLLSSCDVAPRPLDQFSNFVRTCSERYFLSIRFTTDE